SQQAFEHGFGVSDFAMQGSRMEPAPRYMVDAVAANFKGVTIESANIGFGQIAFPSNPARTGKEESRQFAVDQHRRCDVDVTTVAVIERRYDSNPGCIGSAVGVPYEPTKGLFRYPIRSFFCRYIRRRFTDAVKYK